MLFVEQYASVPLALSEPVYPGPGLTVAVYDPGQIGAVIFHPPVGPVTAVHTVRFASVTLMFAP